MYSSICYEVGSWRNVLIDYRLAIDSKMDIAVIVYYAISVLYQIIQLDLV